MEQPSVMPVRPRLVASANTEVRITRLSSNGSPDLRCVKQSLKPVSEKLGTPNFIGAHDRLMS